MSDKSLFRRNLVIIVALHILVIAGLFFSGFFSRHRDDATWLDGGGSPQQQASQSTDNEPTPEETAPDFTPEKTPGDSGTSAPSMIVLGTPVPSATPTPTPTPRRTPEPSTPTPTPTPRTPTPVPSTPRRTPSATPKKSASRSPSPKTSPRKSASPKASSSAKKSASPSDSPKPKATATTGDDGENDGTEATTPGTSTPKGGKPGTRPGEGGGNRGGKGSIGGAEKESQIRWYLEKIHDRIYSRWVSPSSDPELSVLVKIRIEKDGHVSDVTLAKSSGNPAMDESAMLAAKGVKQFDPLPSVIDDSFYDVPIEFKPTPQ